MGKLVVLLIGCKNLVGHDTFSKIDPYVKLTIGNKSFKSHVKDNTEDPNYNEEFTFFVADPQGDRLNLHVYDKDMFSSDDVGFVEIPLHNLPQGQKTERWLELRSKKNVCAGQIGVALTAVDFGGAPGQQQQQQQQRQMQQQQQGGYQQYPPPQQQYPPPQQGGYPPPQQGGGYPPPQQGGGYPPPQQGGGYPPPQQGGYPPPQYPPQQGGGYPPPQQGGYPPPQYPPQQGGGYPPPQQGGGYPPPQYPPQQGGGYPPQQQYTPGGSVGGVSYL